MKVKYELNEIMEINNRMCNTDALYDGSCNAVLEELSQYPKLFKKYNKAFDEQREKIRAVKHVLTTKSSTDDIDRYHQMCFDACQD